MEPSTSRASDRPADGFASRAPRRQSGSDDGGRKGTPAAACRLSRAAGGVPRAHLSRWPRCLRSIRAVKGEGRISLQYFPFHAASRRLHASAQHAKRQFTLATARETSSRAEANDPLLQMCCFFICSTECSALTSSPLRLLIEAVQAGLEVCCTHYLLSCVNFPSIAEYVIVRSRTRALYHQPLS